MKSKAYEFLYNKVNIGFVLNPQNANLMINATEMAKVFDKRIDVFLKTDHAQNFIKTLEKILEKENKLTPNGGHLENNLPPNGGRLDKKVIDYRGRNGVYFERRLALKFASWLDVEFELWVYNMIDNIMFGHYKKHWEAHALQEEAKIKMEELKKKILTQPTPELVAQYFEAEKQQKNALLLKKKAIKQQLNLFNQFNNS